MFGLMRVKTHEQIVKGILSVDLEAIHEAQNCAIDTTHELHEAQREKALYEKALGRIVQMLFDAKITNTNIVINPERIPEQVEELIGLSYQAGVASVTPRREADRLRDYDRGYNDGYRKGADDKYLKDQEAAQEVAEKPKEGSNARVGKRRRAS